MVLLAASLAGDVSIEFRDERATCWNERVPGHVFCRFDSQPGREIPPAADQSYLRQDILIGAASTPS